MREYLALLQGKQQYSGYVGDVVKPTGPRLTDVLDNVLIIKTHHLPADNDDPIVYLVRDGRNATLSFLYMVYLFGGHKFSRLEDAYGGIRYLDATEGSWAAHVRSILAQSDRRPLLILRYEDLMADPSGTLMRLATFVGADLPPSIAAYCVAHQRTTTDYEAQRSSGYRFEPEPGSIYAILKQHRREDYWRLILDERCKRHLHESGATEFLVRLGYEQAEAWWRPAADVHDP